MWLIFAGILIAFGPEISSVAADERDCLLEDYNTTYTACENNARQASYRKSADCKGPAELGNVTLDCTCTREEYVPNYGPCENEQRVFIGYDHLNGCTPNHIPHPHSVPCLCQDEDIVSLYTDCNADTNTKQIVHYFKNPACDHKNSHLPTPQTIPCAMPCDSGYFINPHYTECQLCPAGTYSFKGFIIDQWDAMPKGFHTTCHRPLCKSWDLHGDYIDSGVQDAAEVRSTLSWHLPVLKEQASLSVTFHVESQYGWDFFEITINGVRQTIPLEDITGINNEWVTHTFDLHQQECDSTLVYRNEEHCLTRNFFNPPAPQFGNTTFNSQTACSRDPDKLGCAAIDWEGVDLKGKVAVIKRGNCTFVSKVLNAQRAGALGVMIVNANAGPVRMIGDGTGITIPTGLLGIEAGTDILDDASAGETLPLVVKPTYIEEARIDFTYVKWNTASPRTNAGADRVFIKKVTATGTVLAADSCKTCPVGTYSKQGADNCLPCPANTFSDTPGTPDQCKPCPAHYSSLPGSSTCSKSLGCTMEDYVINRGPCIMTSPGRFVQNFSHSPAFNPPLCQGGLALDVTKVEEVPCLKCPKGMARKNSPECTLCDAGSALGGWDICEPCGEGSTSVKELSYDDFSNGASSFSSSCTGPCLQGWHKYTYRKADHGPYATLLSTGRGLAEGSSSALKREVRLYTEGSVTFEYFYTSTSKTGDSTEPWLDPSSFEIKRITDQSDQAPYHYRVSLPSRGKEVFTERSPSLPPGVYRLVWTHNKTDAFVELVLQSLSVIGEESGGTGSCTTCKAGYACPSNSYAMVPCPKGSISQDGQATCSPCLERSVPSIDHTKCIHCPSAVAEPSESGLYCQLKNCRWTEQWHGTNRTWDLSPFRLIHISQDNTAADQDSVALESGYHISLCGDIKDMPLKNEDLNASQLCGHGSDPSFICQHTQGGFPLVLGGNMEIDWREGNQEKRDLTFDFRDGDTCPESRSSDARYKTRVNLECAPNLDKSSRKEDNYEASVAVDGTDPCLYVVSIRSPHACPACMESSYESVSGPCVMGKKKVSYVLTDGEQCLDVGAHPAPQMMLCQDSNGFSLTEILFVIVAACLLMAVIHLHIKNRRLTVKYSRLSGHAADNGMDEDGMDVGMDDVAIPESLDQELEDETDDFYGL